MLVINDIEYFQKVCVHAERHNMGEAFWRMIYKLHVQYDRAEGVLPNIKYYEPGQRVLPLSWALACKGEYQTTIYKDFAPASFLFNVVRIADNTRVGNGGLILHGPQGGWEMSNGQVIPDGYEVETYAVEIERTNGWAIHT